MRDFILDKLQFFDDPKFFFDPEEHAYTYDGQKLISVTQFISRFHEKMDQDYWSKKKAEQRGVDQSVILAEWKESNDRANFLGTATHEWIENYFKGTWQCLPTDIDIIDRINKFNKIYSTHLHKLTPIKFEQRIFSKKLKIAGTIDSLFTYKDSLVMLDWKTNKKFTIKNDWGSKLLSPFEKWDQCHLNEYSIQLSLYSLILEEVGLDVKICYLVHIGPESDAQIHRCHDFKEVIREYLENNPI